MYHFSIFSEDQCTTSTSSLRISAPLDIFSEDQCTPSTSSLGEMTTASMRPPLEIRRTQLSKLMSPHNHRTGQDTKTRPLQGGRSSTPSKTKVCQYFNSMPRVSPTPNSKSYDSFPIPTRWLSFYYKKHTEQLTTT